MRYHRNAVTNLKQRQAMRGSEATARELAVTYHTSVPTASKWKQRDDSEDRISTPHTIHYAVDPSFWRLIVRVRKRCLFTLDDLVMALSPYVEHLNRDNCFRILKKYQLNKLTLAEAREKKQFATYEPGFLHIDVFYLPKMTVDGVKRRRYCFLAIDRATRLLYLSVYDHKDHRAAADFLVKCLNFFPFKIHHILTDNGKEFTLKSAKNRWGKVKVPSFFDVICEVAGIRHRTTKVKHPWTNGMAERAVRTVKDHTIKLKRYPTEVAMIEDLYVFQDHHNQYRKQRVLRGKTPVEMTVAWFVKEPKLFISDPTVMWSNR